MFPDVTQISGNLSSQSPEPRVTSACHSCPVIHDGPTLCTHKGQLGLGHRMVSSVRIQSSLWRPHNDLTLGPGLIGIPARRRGKQSSALPHQTSRYNSEQKSVWGLCWVWEDYVSCLFRTCIGLPLIILYWEILIQEPWNAKRMIVRWD